MKTIIDGRTIEYDPAIVDEGHYFFSRELGMQERKVFFDEAYNYGSAIFQDRSGYKYKLVHNGGEYQLVKG